MQSGLSREGGSHGVLEFTWPNYVAVTIWAQRPRALPHHRDS